MTLSVEINSQNKEQIINAIKLIKGVKSIKNTDITKEVVRSKQTARRGKKLEKS